MTLLFADPEDRHKNKNDNIQMRNLSQKMKEMILNIISTCCSIYKNIHSNTEKANVNRSLLLSPLI